MAEILIIPTPIDDVIVESIGPDDAQAFFDLYNRSRSASPNYSTGKPSVYPDVNSVETFLNTCPLLGILPFGIYRKNDLVGELNLDIGLRRGTIYYLVGVDHRRQGIATATVRALTDQLMPEYGPFKANIHVNNHPSIRVVESCGFVRQEPVIDGLVRYIKWR